MPCENRELEQKRERKREEGRREEKEVKCIYSDVKNTSSQYSEVSIIYLQIQVWMSAVGESWTVLLVGIRPTITAQNQPFSIACFADVVTPCINLLESSGSSSVRRVSFTMVSLIPFSHQRSPLSMVGSGNVMAISSYTIESNNACSSYPKKGCQLP